MILYFSGTGNSAYVAKRIGKEIGDETYNLFTKIRDNDVTPMKSETAWVIVAPTYAWRIPRILQDWLRTTTLQGNEDVYIVLTCGANIANAGAYMQNLCKEKGLKYCGCIPIIMPENYIAIFEAPTQKESLEIIQKAEVDILEVANLIKSSKPYVQSYITLKDKLCSGIVNDLFYPVVVHAKKFHTSDTCISCGKCEILCPLQNIRLVHGKPIWGKHCTHCMACINHCPSNAIEYGKHSVSLVRYTCPK